MLIARRADVFREVTMRSVDDGSEYVIPVRRRSWTSHSWFRKRNKKRVVPMDAPTRIPPEKQRGKKRAGVQRTLYSARCPQCGIISNFMCCENV
jgi:hypothetical protein